MYYRGLIHHIKENKTCLTDQCDDYVEALGKVSRTIIDKHWIASDCEFSILSDEGNGLKPYYPKVAVSGGFDPVHIGHIRMIREAAKIGEVIVIVNKDDFLIRKKGYVFMPLEERIEVMESIKGVFRVVACVDDDDSVSKTLKTIMPDFFVNGGDVVLDNTLEKEVCSSIGCKLLYNIGGEKIQSSSRLVKGAGR